MRINIHQEIAHRRASICMLEDRLSFGAKVLDEGNDTGRRTPMAYDDSKRAVKTMESLAREIESLERRCYVVQKPNRNTMSEAKNALVLDAIKSGCYFSDEIQSVTGLEKKSVDSCTTSLFRQGKITREKALRNGRECNKWSAV